MVTLFVSLPSIAQKISISWVEIAGNKLIIHYNLDDTNPNHEYAVSVFSSKDNFSAPLTKVTGDVGNEVIPGSNKSITWSITDELGNYRGDIELEIRSKVFLPFLKLTNFEGEKKYKRGKNYPIVWTSGNLNGQVDLELYSKEDRVLRESNIPNTGKYDWFIPGNVKPGKEYRIKFTNTRNREEVVYSKVFRIVPKIPTALKFGALAVIGGGIAALGGGGGGKSGSTDSGVLVGHPSTP